MHFTTQSMLLNQRRMDPSKLLRLSGRRTRSTFRRCARRSCPSGRRGPLAFNKFCQDHLPNFAGLVLGCIEAENEPSDFWAALAGRGRRRCCRTSRRTGTSRSACRSARPVPETSCLLSLSFSSRRSCFKGIRNNMKKRNERK